MEKTEKGKKKKEEKRKNNLLQREKFIVKGKQGIMQSEYVGLARCIVFFVRNVTEHYYSFCIWCFAGRALMSYHTIVPNTELEVKTLQLSPPPHQNPLWRLS